MFELSELNLLDEILGSQGCGSLLGERVCSIQLKFSVFE